MLLEGAGRDLGRSFVLLRIQRTLLERSAFQKPHPLTSSYEFHKFPVSLMHYAI